MQHKNQRGTDSVRKLEQHDMVFMLGEELKKPLTAIQLMASIDDKNSPIYLEAQKALRTIDNVLFYQQLTDQQLALQLEPVHIGSVLARVSAELTPLSQQQGCEIELDIQSGMTTVDVDAKALQSGIESLWQAVLAMTMRPSPLVWHVYRMKEGVRVAVLNNTIDMSGLSMMNSIASAGKSRQPFATIAGPATDLVTAHGMFGLLGGSLRKVKKDGLHGFAVTLRASPQLAFNIG